MHRLTFILITAMLAGCAARAPAPQPEIVVHHTRELTDVVAAASRLATRYGEDNVLVAFDLDNTLLAMESELGADQWYDWQRELQAADPCDPRLVPDRLAVQGALYHVGAMRLTEASALGLIDALKAAGHPLMIITARGSDFRLPTFRELRRNQLYLADAAPGPRRGIEGTFLLDPDGRPVRYEDGVLMLAGQHKGNMLLALYRRLGLPLPEAVVFVDDKETNAATVVAALDEENIPAEIFVYDGELSRVQAFDAEAAAAQWARIAPALRTIEAVVGPVNFDLPERDQPERCPPQ